MRICKYTISQNSDSELILLYFKDMSYLQLECYLLDLQEHYCIFKALVKFWWNWHQELISSAFCADILATKITKLCFGNDIFGPKMSAQNGCIKCWWNWHQDGSFHCYIGLKTLSRVDTFLLNAGWHQNNCFSRHTSQCYKCIPKWRLATQLCQQNY